MENNTQSIEELKYSIIDLLNTLPNYITREELSIEISKILISDFKKEKAEEAEKEKKMEERRRIGPFG